MAYNNIYETLISRAQAKNEVLIGYIAYSLYKKQKAEFFQNQTTAGISVTSSQKEVFHAAFTTTALENLENQARQLLLAFADDYLESDITSRERDIIENSVSQKVDAITSDLAALKSDISNEISTNTSFGKAFWPGMATNVAFLFATAAVAMAWALSSPDTMKNFLKVFAPSA